MNIKLANTLFDDGVFSAMYKAGFITAKFHLPQNFSLGTGAGYTRGIAKNTAVLEAEAKFRKDERTIWRALNSFEENN